MATLLQMASIAAKWLGTFITPGEVVNEAWNIIPAAGSLSTSGTIALTQRHVELWRRNRELRIFGPCKLLRSSQNDKNAHGTGFDSFMNCPHFDNLAWSNTVQTKGYEYEFRTEVKASPEEVWEHASTMAGVNMELSPIIRMTYPQRCASLNAESMNKKNGYVTSWILLFGLIPVDRWVMHFVEFGPRFRFLERSKVCSMKFWEHERNIVGCNGGALIIDRIRFIPIMKPLAPIVARMMRTVFINRHRNLKKIFNAPV